MVSIELLATDGKTMKRILWVSHLPKGVSAGFHIQGLDAHKTHHVDGSIWETIGDRSPCRVGHGPRLDSFQGIAQIGDFTFSTETSEIEEFHRPYEMEAIGSVLFVDLRSYREGAVGCSVFLLEPFALEWLRSSLVPPTGSNLRAPSEVHLLTTLKPWLVLTFRSVPKIRGTKNFKNAL